MMSQKPNPFDDWEEADTKFARVALCFIKHAKVVSEEEINTLNKMINSPDPENTVLAVEVIKIKAKDV